MVSWQSLFSTKRFRATLTKYQAALKNPLTVQEIVLQKILSKNKHTAYGRKYGFEHISSIEDFQKNVPIITYEDIFDEYVSCMLKGMSNVLVKDKVVYFATTSGTTSRPKLMPVTKTRTKQLQQELLLWSFFMLKRPHIRKGLRGKMLYFAGPIIEEVSAGGTPMGSISGYMASKTPFWASSRLVIPPFVYNEMNFEKKTRTIALLALATSNITQLGFAAPIEAILFFDYVIEHKESLLSELESQGKKARVRQLRKLKEFTPSMIWPRLCLVNCIKSVANIPYLEVIKQRLGRDVEIRDPGIFASEGRLTLGLTDHDAAGVLVAHENFFEFMPKKGDGFSKPVTVDKLRLGKEYKVIMTTREGLYRYDIGDVVRVVDFKGNLPVVSFVMRDNFLNIVGEFCPENQLFAAFDSVCNRLGVVCAGYTFVPYTLEVTKRPCYEVLIEPTGRFEGEEFARELDSELKSRVQDYRQMREEFGRLGHLRLGIVKKGGYIAFNKDRLSRAGQPKPVRVAKDSDFRKKFSLIQEVVVE